MQKIAFSPEEKIRHFDELSDLFYKRNFGNASKADIELLMFHFYLEKLLCENQNNDGLANNSACSDFRISQELGITQQRVRNLKVKKQLVYPVEYDWQKALANRMNLARCDETGTKVTVPINDPNLFMEIENFIEEQGWFIEKQLNNKLLQMRVEFFVQLAIAIASDKDQKSILKMLNEKEKSNTVKVDTIGSYLKNNADSFIDIVGMMISLLPGAGTPVVILKQVLKIVGEIAHNIGKGI